MKVKALKQKYSGSETEASGMETKRAMNRAFACRYFGVKASIPTDLLKEAIKDRTGENMSFTKFKYWVTK